MKDIHSTRIKPLQARSTTYGRKPLNHTPIGKKGDGTDYFFKRGKGGMEYELDTDILMKYSGNGL